MSQPRLELEQQEQRTGSPWWSVHVARYQYSLPFVRGKRVLDIACGTGYGLAIMMENAALGVGVDLDLEAAQKADRSISGKRAGILVADGCRLPFPDSCFDVVTSFETLEHLDQRSEFLAELRRVLRSDGVCVLSTPNAENTKPVDGRPKNPYHVHEYTAGELEAELRKHFASVEMSGQKLCDRFRVSPFWDEQERMRGSIRLNTRRLLWRALWRLPAALADVGSTLLWGHQLIPRPEDFIFDRTIGEEAMVLMAVCKGAE